MPKFRKHPSHVLTVMDWQRRITGQVKLIHHGAFVVVLTDSDINALEINGVPISLRMDLTCNEEIPSGYSPGQVYERQRWKLDHYNPTRADWLSSRSGRQDVSSSVLHKVREDLFREIVQFLNCDWGIQMAAVGKLITAEHNHQRACEEHEKATAAEVKAADAVEETADLLEKARAECRRTAPTFKEVEGDDA